jgi:hypothetical protein
MKVVKCLEHIDKRFWGRIVEDSSDFKPSDTFPLPEQGDKVEVSDDGVNWDESGKDDYYLISYHKKDDLYIVEDANRELWHYAYIRPIEQASAAVGTSSTAVGTSSTTCISEADETLLALRDIQKDLHEIFEYLKDN